MGEQNKLYYDVEKLVNSLQESFDLDCAQSVSLFTSKSRSNEAWLEELENKFKLKDDVELDDVENLRAEIGMKLNMLEDKVSYYERLYKELEEFQNEIKIKTVVNNRRQSRTPK
ncbi:ASN_HP2_G0031410.mRNA.1.CDS.1 [Saccharomyces cerevisiae]|nr:BGP_1a_G0032550.mRNA.1.CDS.1 [Saccharomyces cerevisiae]CAI4576417.1 BAK_1a_G0032410.mRNA.1.CDS.1 [Saccharomyces cerevisiae]CAI4579133.1 BGN_3a_G0032660.mRNA.1.CDS.1 [Saccharomyces cerevisiae]CAI5296194.1 BFH_HP2_G0032530.mRNA.1.CDS.1 [Saccharomyces cerevisiae]CAI5313179.1 ASN_HP2_G0031410.mRNA.1.CDS.1 [Saccharomyces cerevisiae]